MTGLLLYVPGTAWDPHRSLSDAQKATLLPSSPLALQAPPAHYAIPSDEHAFGLFTQPQGPEARDLTPIAIFFTHATLAEHFSLPGSRTKPGWRILWVSSGVFWCLLVKHRVCIYVTHMKQRGSERDELASGDSYSRFGTSPRAPAHSHNWRSRLFTYTFGDIIECRVY